MHLIYFSLSQSSIFQEGIVYQYSARVRCVIKREIHLKESLKHFAYSGQLVRVINFDIKVYLKSTLMRPLVLDSIRYILNLKLRWLNRLKGTKKFV